MKTTVRLINSNLWCPHCATGTIVLQEIILDAAPECEPDVELVFACSDCFKVVTIEFSELPSGDTGLGLTFMLKLYEKRGWR